MEFDYGTRMKMEMVPDAILEKTTSRAMGKVKEATLLATGDTKVTRGQQDPAAQ